MNEEKRTKTLKKLPPPEAQRGEDASLHQSVTVKSQIPDIPFVPPPESPYPEPVDEKERFHQAAGFVRKIFFLGEHFELTPAIAGSGGKLRPRRDKKNDIGQLEPSDFSEEVYELFKRLIEAAPDGMYISINPCCSSEELQHTSVRDADIVDFRNVLVECDELPKEEQLKRLRELRLPVRGVTWSGGKSCHILVAIDAGPDLELYKKRTTMLYDYLKSMGFPADPTYKNPSRLTRLPGAKRGGATQYLMFDAFGYSSWDDFEKSLPGTTKQDKSSRCLSYSFDITTNELIDLHGEPFSLNRDGSPSGINQCFFAAYVVKKRHLLWDPAMGWHEYQPDTGLWTTLREARLKGIIADDILEFARDNHIPELAVKRTANLCRDILTLMNGLPCNPAPFKLRTKKLIHVGNGMIEFTEAGDAEFKPFSPDYRSRSRSEVDYDRQAGCPRFLTQLLAPAMTQDDIDCLQLYFGQCLLGVNHAQMFLMLTGTPGAGKSTLVNIIEGVISRKNCTELRLEHMAERFEMNRLIGKTLLTAKDVKSYFLNTRGAHKLKALTGKDTLTAEAKGRNEAVDIVGEFNVIITGNSDLQIDVDADNGAWRRRMLWVRYECPPVTDKIDAFDELLLREEGSGILNWGIEGACRLLKNGGRIPRSEDHLRRIDELLQESNSISAFIDTCVIEETGACVTSEELYLAYLEFCRERDWEPKADKVARQGFRSTISAKFHVSFRHDIPSGNGYARRGYAGIKIKR